MRRRAVVQHPRRWMTEADDAIRELGSQIYL